VRSDTLNFSRVVALREVMTQHGDGTKRSGRRLGLEQPAGRLERSSSLWGSVTLEQQVSYTLGALDRADREGLARRQILQQWQPPLTETDPQWGFKIIDGRITQRALCRARQSRGRSRLP